MSSNILLLNPPEVVFRDVQFSQVRLCCVVLLCSATTVVQSLQLGIFFLQVYHQNVSITNTLKGPVEITIKPGSSDRYTVTPSSLRIKPGETVSIDIRLKVLRFAQKQKAIEQGQRDIFHIKVESADCMYNSLNPTLGLIGLLHHLQGNFFDQKFYANFFLAPDAVEPTGKLLPQRPRSTSSPSR